MLAALPPQILQFPEDMKILAGEKVEILCRFSGAPPINCTWLKFRKPVRETHINTHTHTCAHTHTHTQTCTSFFVRTLVDIMYSPAFIGTLFLFQPFSVII